MKYNHNSAKLQKTLIAMQEGMHYTLLHGDHNLKGAYS